MPSKASLNAAMVSLEMPAFLEKKRNEPRGLVSCFSNSQPRVVDEKLTHTQHVASIPIHFVAVDLSFRIVPI